MSIIVNPSFLWKSYSNLMRSFPWWYIFSIPNHFLSPIHAPIFFLVLLGAVSSRRKGNTRRLHAGYVTGGSSSSRSVTIQGFISSCKGCCKGEISLIFFTILPAGLFRACILLFTSTQGFCSSVALSFEGRKISLL